MSLASITEKTLKLKPMGTGSTLLLNDDMIISYSNKKYNGTKVTEHSDDLLLTHIYETYKKNPSEVQKLQGKGKTYYVYYTKVPETNWTLISYVNEADVIAELNHFMVVCGIIAIIMVIVIVVVIIALMKTIVTKPVKNLTDIIIEITNKNFALDIPDHSNDEIGVMNHNMRKFISHMHSTLSTMKDVTNQLSAEAENSRDESAKQINNIIEMINSIASQTNLLSLNASIEAARAGEAGKGFAVVADEIGKLANDSANATTEIATIIGDIANQISSLSQKSTENVSAIKKSTESVETAEKTFEKIFNNLEGTGLIVKDMITSMSDINDIATNLASISEEQAASSQEVTSTLEKLAVSAQNVSESSMKVKDSAVIVSSGADTINESVNVFKL